MPTETSTAPQYWEDRYAQGQGSASVLTIHGPFSYEGKKWDYSETTAEWLLRKQGQKVYVPPTNVYTLDRRRVEARAFELKIQHHSSGTDRRYIGRICPTPNQLYWNGIGYFDWSVSLLKAMANAKDAKINLGEMFFTRAETYRLVADNLVWLVELARFLKHPTPQGAARLGLSWNPAILSKTLAERWLEYQYGWKPLLSDCFAGYELLRAADLEQPYRLSAKGKTVRTAMLRGDVTLELFDYWGSTSRVLCDADAEITSKSRLDFMVPFDAITWQRRTRVDNPALIAWELIPYSFVADWFVPIGTYLDAIGYANGLTFLGGHTSVTSLPILRLRGDASGGQSVSTPTATVDGKPIYIGKSHQRKKYTGVPPPPPFPAADWDGLSKGVRFWNALALLRAAF